jgi:cob(I)alamin adenosyltransferase
MTSSEEPTREEPTRDEPEKIRTATVRADSIVIVNTGDGKGKSTAAFGTMLRAVARGWSVGVVQFMKSEKWKVGEEKVGVSLGVHWLKGGDGFSWESNDLDATERLAVHTWQVARSAIEQGEHHLVILDEITYPMRWGWIDTDEVVATIENRPRHVNIVATGRSAPAGLINVADTITEMVNVRHAFDQGIKARRGIDF